MFHWALTQGQFTQIDEDDVPLVREHRWRAVWIEDRWYASSQTAGYLHRFLLDAPADLTVDHRDGNGLNNQRSNLRLATHTENMRNRRLHSNNTSGHKGVGWDKRRGKWVARIHRNGGTIHLGSFDRIEDAVNARERGAREEYGDFS